MSLKGSDPFVALSGDCKPRPSWPGTGDQVYRCFLPDLTGFTSHPCPGPDPGMESPGEDILTQQWYTVKTGIAESGQRYHSGHTIDAEYCYVLREPRSYPRYKAEEYPGFYLFMKITESAC